MFKFVFTFILIAIFLPLRQADLTASALLQGTRSEVPQLRTMCLASAATSTCSSSRLIRPFPVFNLIFYD